MLKPPITPITPINTTRLSHPQLLSTTRRQLQLSSTLAATTITYHPHVRPPLSLKRLPTPLTIFSRNCSSSSNSNSNSKSNSTSTSNSNNPPPPTYAPTMTNEEMSRYLKQSHDSVFTRNAAWASAQKTKDPSFFEKLSAGQTPEYLWIGCSDSRMPAEQITGLQPGEAFIHRNIANLVVNADLNAMAVIEYAVRHLRVKHVVVCGHYGCGGVKAAMTARDLGLLNPWLRNIRDVYRLHEAELDRIGTEAERYDRLVELSVVEQCRNVIKTAAVQQSYEQDHFPIVHGWVFDFKDGLLKDLKVDHEAMLHSIQKIYNLTKDN